MCKAKVSAINVRTVHDVLDVTSSWLFALFTNSTLTFVLHCFKKVRRKIKRMGRKLWIGWIRLVMDERKEMYKRMRMW